ncbi:MAG TPA: CoA transferase, partial [Geodermatophilus sp.]|nr:CoA transferase [Geodermatophilus sp.]
MRPAPHSSARLRRPSPTRGGHAVPPSQGPLAGLTVVELTSTFLGPYCAVLMAQMGARVVKVEPPGGDIIRGVG